MELPLTEMGRQMGGAAFLLWRDLVTRSSVVLFEL